MTGRLSGKVALVTGGAAGIGKSIALHFAREGARVGVLDVNGESAMATCREIEQDGGSALALAADVRHAPAVQHAVDRLHLRYGELHVLVNNAGTARKKMFEQMTAQDWDEVWNTNLTGVMNTLRSALPLLKCRRGAKIINMASIEVFSHSRKLSAYAASKAALAGLSRTLAVELAPHQICVNYICPGFIRTELTRPYYERWLFRKYVQRVTPLGRMGEPEDVARVALFLASNDADYVTGQGIVVDGGLTLQAL